MLFLIMLLLLIFQNHIPSTIWAYGIYSLLIIGATSFAVGIYYMFIPMKRAKGIRDEDLPAFSKASGVLLLLVGASTLFILFNEKFDMFDSDLAAVFPLAVFAFCFAAQLVLSIIYKKRNRE